MFKDSSKLPAEHATSSSPLTVTETAMPAPAPTARAHSPLYGTISAILMAMVLLLVPSIFVTLLVGVWSAGQRDMTHDDLIALLESTTGRFAYMTAATLGTFGLLWYLMRLTRETRQSIALVRCRLSAIWTVLGVAIVYFMILAAVSYVLTNYTAINEVIRFTIRCF